MPCNKQTPYTKDERKWKFAKDRNRKFNSLLFSCNPNTHKHRKSSIAMWKLKVWNKRPVDRVIVSVWWVEYKAWEFQLMVQPWRRFWILEFGGFQLKKKNRKMDLMELICTGMYCVGPWLVCFEFSLGDWGRYR